MRDEQGMMFENESSFTQLDEAGLKNEAQKLLGNVIQDYLFYDINKIVNEDYHITKLIFDPINLYLKRRRVAFIGIGTERWSDTQEVYYYKLLLVAVERRDEVDDYMTMIPPDWLNDIYAVNDIEMMGTALKNIYYTMLKSAQDFINNEAL